MGNSCWKEWETLMRTRFWVSIGRMLGVLAGVLLATASIAADDPSAATASGSASNATVTAQIDELTSQVQADSRTGLELLIRSRGVQAKRPRAKDDEDAAARSQRQKDLVQWISDIKAMRSELQNHEAKLDASSDQIGTLRKLDMTDEEVARLVNLELGIHNVMNAVQRGTRELDLASRRGTNALDSSAD
jgi:hypothetical protein